MLRAFIVAVLALPVLFLAPAAFSAPKTIAIVNLSPHSSAKEAAVLVRMLLNQNEELRPTTPGDLARALEAPLPEGGPTTLILAEASEALQEGQKAFTDFKDREALRQLRKARQLLLSLHPTATTSEALANVSFHIALLHLREQNLGLAMGELQLLHRLVKREHIDPVRYAPDVVRAFQKARKNATSDKSATLTISATYDGAPIFVDGKAAGKAPLRLSLGSGSHLIVVAAPQYQAAAIRIDLDPGSAVTRQIDLKPRLLVSQAWELRFAARKKGLRAQDLRMAAASVSRLLGSDAVLLLVGSQQTGTTETEATLYIPHLERLSFRRLVNEQLKDMFGLVLEVPRPTLFDGLGRTAATPWYKRPFGIAAISGGTALAILSIFALSTSAAAAPPRNGEPTFDFETR